MTRVLLDTNIIVDAFRQRNDHHVLINDLWSQGRPLASCPITFGICRTCGAHMANGCPLLTENTKDFPMPGLQLYPPPRKV